MLVKAYTADDDRATLGAMITDQQLLASVAARWVAPGLFGSPMANTIGGWCVDHYRTYQTAPGPAIQQHYQVWAVGADKELADAVGQFMAWHSASYMQVATAFALDTAEALFARASLKRLVAEVQVALDNNKPTLGVQAVESWAKPVIKASAGVSVFEDPEALAAAFAEAAEPLIKYPGALGQFFAGQLARDSFIALLAPEKRGKSWSLMDIAVQAMADGNRVAYFCTGDMSQSQWYRRFAGRMTRCPNYAKTVRIPTSLAIHRVDNLPSPVVEYKEVARPAVTLAAATELFAKVAGSGKRERLKLHVSPAGSMGVADIQAILDGWTLQGWVPDVIIIDYADVLAAPPGYKAGDRSSHNAIWEKLRGLSQLYHCCLVTATQTDAEGGRAYLLTRDRFSEDKRKLAHVTGMVGVNQIGMEKAMGVYRLNWIVLREAEYSETNCVYTAGCLSVGQPFILSAWPAKESDQK